MKLKNIAGFIKKIISVNIQVFKDLKSQKKLPESRKINYRNFYNDLHEEYSPAFLLSTGRCGTKLLTNMMEEKPRIIVEHTPRPELIYYSKFAYENKEDNKTLEHILDASRFDVFHHGYLYNKKYFETNNRITFFAPAISTLYPKSKFIHLVRHPGVFVRSGIRRKWYMGASNHDMGRIVPVDGNIPWKKMNDIEKIGWLWNETNQFVEDFKEKLQDKSRCITVKAEDMFTNPDTIIEIFKHLGLKAPPKKEIVLNISKPVNVQRSGDFPEYEKWSTDKKRQLKKWAPLAGKYNYEL